MAFKLHNTLSRKLQPFKPLQEGKVRMYTCGPTVYNYAHIGNFRAYVFADLLKRYLRYADYQVHHVMNITDVDDKTIRDSQKEGTELAEFTQRYEASFLEDCDTLRISPADLYPRATEHVQEMIQIIEKLLEKKIAYKGEDGSVYFNVRKFKKYGQLANIKLDELQTGASGRVLQDEYESKEHVQDFALWKAYTPDDGKVVWDASFGRGRPGWHIECSAMSMKYLSNTFDIHTGGVDLIFPHHQNEIAQSEASTGKTFVKYWLHNEWLLVDGQKMSKSKGNFYTLRDVLQKGYDPVAVRYVLMATHYRQKLNFTFASLEAAQNALTRLRDFVRKLGEQQAEKDSKKLPKLLKNAETAFGKAFDADLDISAALAAVFDLVRDVNTLMADGNLSAMDAVNVKALMAKFDTVLGVIDHEEEKLPADIAALIKKREAARAAKDWKQSDVLRDEIKAKGYLIEDTPHGTRYKRA